jgi:hypothetical protein
MLFKKKKLVWSYISTFLYIDDALSVHNSKFGVYVFRSHSIELDIKDTNIYVCFHTLSYT